MKAPYKYQFYFSFLNELYGCCLWQRDTTVALWRTSYYLSYSLGCFGNFHGTHLANNLRQPSPPTENLACSQEMACWDSVFPIAKYPHWNHLHIFQDFPLHSVSISTPQALEVQLFLLAFSSLPHFFTNLIFLLLAPPTPNQTIKSILFTSPRKIHSSPLVSSSLPNLSRSMNCSLVIIYVTTIIYLQANMCQIYLSGSDYLIQDNFVLVSSICQQILWYYF